MVHWCCYNTCSHFSSGNMLFDIAVLSLRYFTCNILGFWFYALRVTESYKRLVMPSLPLLIFVVKYYRRRHFAAVNAAIGLLRSHVCMYSGVAGREVQGSRPPLSLQGSSMWIVQNRWKFLGIGGRLYLTCCMRNCVSWFSGKSFKLLPPHVRFEG